MFSGIVESCASIRQLKRGPGVLSIEIEKPSHFDDLKPGDSVAVNGVCLTIEKLTADAIMLTAAAETLAVTGWDQNLELGQTLNLERSMRLGDRIHGHYVSGHVDDLGLVISCQDQGLARLVTIQFPQKLKSFIWSKGSIAVNGVSLTINAVDFERCEFSLCLIPETLKRTNFAGLTVGQNVNLEIDYLARGLVHLAERKELKLWN